MLVQSAYASLFTQAITGLVDIYGLTIDVEKEFEIFKQLLALETGVQIIEFIFYIWLVTQIKKNKNITKYRYFDWAITTPIMLITLMAYYSGETSLKTFFEKHKGIVAQVISLNTIMLIIGFLGEQELIDTKITATLGFIPFIIYYRIIFTNFVKNTTKSKALFWYFFIVWSLYGVAAYLPYEIKNTSYNILDLFSKNFFGLFLVYYVWTKRIKN
jgi:bacteriorhodopsin